MAKTLDTTCGIYSTEYTLTKHRDGTGTVRAPWIKWIGSTGTLAFTNHHIPKKHMHSGAVLGFFDRGELCDETGDTLDSYLSGYCN